MQGVWFYWSLGIDQEKEFVSINRSISNEFLPKKYNIDSLLIRHKAYWFVYRNWWVNKYIYEIVRSWAEKTQ